MSAEQESASSIGAPLGNDNAVGNAGGHAPVGNTNALGNSGGGAPEGNTNRRSHGVYCSLEKIDQRAEGDVAEFINRMESAIRERVDGEVSEVAREIPLRMIRLNRAVRDIQRRGVELADGERNPMLPTARRILNRVFEDLEEIGAT